jgi:large subunit ribosomal protein L4
MVLYVPVINNHDISKSVEVSNEIFGCDFNETLIHQVVVKYLANARSGTKSQKNRSDVSGGGIKPWRQKGTGRARAGSTRGPIWRTGGVAFAARPRDYQQKLNKKMYRLGMKSILSELLRQGRLIVVDEVLSGVTGKTKDLHQRLKIFNEKRLLLITSDVDNLLELAARNIPYVQALCVQKINPVSLVSAEKVLLTREALVRMEECLA